MPVPGLRPDPARPVGSSPIVFFGGRMKFFSGVFGQICAAVVEGASLRQKG